MSSVGMFSFGRPPHQHVRPTGEFSDLDGKLNLGVYGASAGAYGTIADLWKFDHALLTGRLVGKAYREAMWKSTRENGFYGFFQWIYPSPLAGCGKTVRIVERQGLVGGIELRNYLLPQKRPRFDTVQPSPTNGARRSLGGERLRFRCPVCRGLPALRFGLDAKTARQT